MTSAAPLAACPIVRSFCTVLPPPVTPDSAAGGGTGDHVGNEHATPSDGASLPRGKKRKNRNDGRLRYSLVCDARLLLKNLPCRSSRPSYRTVDAPIDRRDGDGVKDGDGGEISLGRLLRGTTVVEYPTIEVVREGDRRHFPALVEEVEGGSSSSSSSSSGEDSSSGDESESSCADADGDGD